MAQAETPAANGQAPEGLVRIQGHDYDLDELTLDELEEIEARCDDQPLERIDFNRAKYLKVLVHVLLRREKPKLKIEDVGKLTSVDLVSANGASADARPPAQKKRASARS